MRTAARGDKPTAEVRVSTLCSQLWTSNSSARQEPSSMFRSSVATYRAQAISPNGFGGYRSRDLRCSRPENRPDSGTAHEADRTVAGMVADHRRLWRKADRPADFAMPLALGRRASQFPVLIEERLILARLAVDVAVPLVEAAGARIVPVDVDLEPVSYTHLRAHETRHDLVCSLL